jgi:hypothetical protein
MSRIRFIILSMLAALAVSATISASASAEEFVIEGTPIAEGSEIAVEGNAGHGTNTLENVVKGTNVNIICEEGLVPPKGDDIEDKGKYKSDEELTACAVTSANSKGITETLSTCKLKGGGFTIISEGELNGAGIFFAEQIGKEPLATLTLEAVNKEGGACAIAGTYKMEGVQACPLPHQEIIAYVLVFACNPVGASVELDGELANLYSTVAISGTKGQKLSTKSGNSFILRDNPPAWQLPTGGAASTFLAEYKGSGTLPTISVVIGGGAFSLETSPDECEGKAALKNEETCEIKLKCVGARGSRAGIHVKNKSWFVNNAVGLVECT